MFVGGCARHGTTVTSGVLCGSCRPRPQFLGNRHAMEHRGHRTRRPEGGRGPGEACRVRYVPLRRAPGDRRPSVRVADHRRARGRRSRHQGRPRRELARGGRSRRVRVHPVVRPLPQLLDRPSEPLRSRRPHGCWEAGHRRHITPPRPGQRSQLDVSARYVCPRHRGQRGELHQDREGRAPRPRLPARLWRGDRWGSSVYAAEVSPGDVVAVVGVGGIGADAIQGAKLAGAKQIWAIDPIESKREKAMEFGARTPQHRWRRRWSRSALPCGAPWPTR